MKKNLIFLLITIITCLSASVVEGKGITLPKLPEYANQGWSKQKEFVIRVVDFLKEIGLWDKLVQVSEKYGLKAARELCLEEYEEKFCNELIEFFIYAKSGPKESWLTDLFSP